MPVDAVGDPRPENGNDVNGDESARVGLAPHQRYRCLGCGNVTRFDVGVTETAQLYWHADLSGRGRVDSQQRETSVHRVTCRWCGASDVAIEPRPTGSAQHGSPPTSTAPPT